MLLVDPQPFFCEAMASALSSIGFDIAGWTGDEIEALELASATDPDVVLAESDLARGSGLGLVRRLRDKRCVVLLTRRPEGDLLLEAAAAGAAGCIGHATNLSTLGRLVREAASGRFAVDPERLGGALKRAAARRTRRTRVRVAKPSTAARWLQRGRPRKLPCHASSRARGVLSIGLPYPPGAFAPASCGAGSPADK